MKLFVTGATGYIGKVVVEHAVRAGHAVEALARNQEGAARVAQFGGTPVIADLKSYDVLAAAASRADAVLHLAYIHDFSLDYSFVIDTEVKAVTALAKGAQRHQSTRALCSANAFTPSALYSIWQGMALMWSRSACRNTCTEEAGAFSCPCSWSRRRNMVFPRGSRDR